MEVVIKSMYSDGAEVTRSPKCNPDEAFKWYKKEAAELEKNYISFLLTIKGNPEERSAFKALRQNQ